MAIVPRQALLSCAGDPCGDIADGALWLAAEDCDDVDRDAALALLDGLGTELRQRMDDLHGADAVPVIAGLLHDRLSLHGAGGGDPRTHYLHTVLARGAGIPISCGAVWIATGRRAGIDIEGVGLPGHFAVRIDGVLADPAAGETLDDSAALRLVGASVGGELPALQPAWLQPASPRSMLARMSRNLRGCHSSLENWELAVRAADRCVALAQPPEEAGERRDRGLLLWRAGHNTAALSDLRHYLDSAPHDAPDRAALEEVVGRLRAALN